MSIISQLVRIIAPHECIGCGVEDHLLCSHCSATLPSAQVPVCPHGVATLYATTRYQGLAKAVLHALKFERAAAAAEDIARCMTTVITSSDIRAVAPIPTASVRIRQRGYDQAQLIARAVARQLHLPYTPLLLRIGNQRQLGAGRATRQQQLCNAFRLKQGIELPNGPILLIDDVLTTGATIEAAARVLCAAGAQRIDAAVFAVAEASQPPFKLV